MVLLITDRDKLIISYLEKYRYATIEQLEKMFFKEQQYSYNIVRKRLGEIRKAGYIKIHRDIETNKNIYIWNEDRIKPPSWHRIILLNVLTEMVSQGYKVEIFKIEKEWMDRKIRSDGFVVFTIGTRRYHFFIEVQISNNPNNLEKYDILYKTNEVQKYLGKDFFPRVLLISDAEYNFSNLKHTSIIQLDTKLNKFSSILI